MLEALALDQHAKKHDDTKNDEGGHAGAPSSLLAHSAHTRMSLT